MAIISTPADIADTRLSIEPKTAEAIMYVLIAILAIAIAVPAAIATANAKLFDECFEDCVAP